MPTIDVILIVVAALAGIIGVLMSCWDDIAIWWFEFQYGKLSPEMAMEMSQWHGEMKDKHNERLARIYEMYAVRIIERAERKAKHKD